MPDVLIVKITRRRHLGWWIHPWLGPALYGLGLRHSLCGGLQASQELEDAARVEGAGWFSICFKVTFRSRATYLATACFPVSSHWKLFRGRWSSPTRHHPLTVGLSIFGAPSRESTSRSSRPGPCWRSPASDRLSPFPAQFRAGLALRESNETRTRRCGCACCRGSAAQFDKSDVQRRRMRNRRCAQPRTFQKQRLFSWFLTAPWLGACPEKHAFLS